MKLDGTETPKPTPFDAHEQVVRSQHTHSAAEGYQPAEYEHAEYPKHVVTGKDDDGKDIVTVVNSAEEEAALTEAGEATETAEPAEPTEEAKETEESAE